MPLITTSRFRRFQSTPLPTGRSDALAKQVEALQAKVSIHAPPNRKERLTRLDENRARLEFQSTPLPTGRSDTIAAEFLPQIIVSIHAPPNRKERRPCLKVYGGARLVSIHAPPNRKERPVAECADRPTTAVSIHAPPNRKERPSWPDIAVSVSRFQSTPLPTGRSDFGFRLRPQ